MRLGIGFEGGGARCAAQAGALVALMEAGLMPSAVAAMFAVGMDGEAMRRSVGRAARSKRHEKWLHGEFGGIPLRDLPPIAIPTVDSETGAIQVLASTLPLRFDPRPWSRNATLAGAVCAGMASPGAASPVLWRGHRLMGGGMTRGTLPSLLRAMGAERVLVLRVLEGGCGALETDPRALAAIAHALLLAPPPDADLTLCFRAAPPARVLDRRQMPALFAQGAEWMGEQMRAVRRLLGRERGKIIFLDTAAREGGET